MHRTKGSGIENIIVVLDEQSWNKYNFSTIFDKDLPPDNPKKCLILNYSMSPALEQ